MRIALVSDIHGNLPALEAVVQDIRRRGADVVVNLGDSLSGPLMPRETAQFLRMQNWIHLAGNHERQLLAPATGEMGLSDAFARSQLGDEDLAWVASLRPTCSNLPGILFCHGTPDSDLDYLLETVYPSGLRAVTAGELEQRLNGVESSLIACGHSHLPRAIRTARGQWVINPGSVGLPAYEDDLPYLHRAETGSPDARYALVENPEGAWITNLVSVPYDHGSMSRLAMARSRPDWARALATGYAR